MSEINELLHSLYWKGVDHKTLKALSTESAQRIHRYLLDVAESSPETYSSLEELSTLLNIPYGTTWRIIKNLDKQGLLDYKQLSPQRQTETTNAGGKGKTVWRTRL